MRVSDIFGSALFGAHEHQHKERKHEHHHEERKHEHKHGYKHHRHSDHCHSH